MDGRKEGRKKGRKEEKMDKIKVRSKEEIQGR